ncbi:MAG TPA: STAS domain-containing protein [Acidimicrobiales bacterium]|nr:STAS domain-containing protein [Acidimicrobiales bacterium]
MVTTLETPRHPVAPVKRLVLDVVHDGADHVLVTVNGEVCAYSAPGLATRLWPALDARPRTVVLDFRGITFFDAAGVRVLVELRRRAGDRDIRVEMLASPAVRRVLSLCRLDDLVVLVDRPPVPQRAIGVIDLRGPAPPSEPAPRSCAGPRPAGSRRDRPCS